MLSTSIFILYNLMNFQLMEIVLFLLCVFVNRSSATAGSPAFERNRC